MTAYVSVHLNTVRAKDLARGRLADDLGRFTAGGGKVQHLEPAELSQPVAERARTWHVANRDRLPFYIPDLDED